MLTKYISVFYKLSDNTVEPMDFDYSKKSLIFDVKLKKMESKQTFKKRAEEGKDILSKQSPFTLEELKEQMHRIKKHSVQDQRKKRKG